jgi:DNA polymerase epsilon subunit 1
MQKVFAQLIAEFRKLGATIIYADFSRIIIDTGKVNVITAQGYCEYLLKTLQSRYFSNLACLVYCNYM